MDIHRTIYIFSARFLDPGGVEIPDQGLPWSELATMPYASGASSRAQTIHSEEHAAAVRVLPTGIVEGTYSALRFNGLPMRKDRKEQRSELPLTEDEGLDYTSHWVWRDLSSLPAPPHVAHPRPVGILAWENNHAAPRIPTMVEYVNQLFEGRYFLEVTPVSPDDVWQDLLRRGVCGSITVRVARPKHDRGWVDGLPMSSIWSQATADVGSFVLTLNPDRGEKITVSAMQARIAAWRAASGVERLTVAVENGQLLDLLSPRLRFRCTVPSMPGRLGKHVSTAAMFQELHHVLDREWSQMAHLLGRLA